MTPPSSDDSPEEYERTWEVLMMRREAKPYANPYGSGLVRAVRVGMRPGILGTYPKPNVKPPPPPPPK